MGRDCCGGRGSSERPSSEDTGRKYIPSEDMGDYEEFRKKESPKKAGPLFPLDEEGSYGAPPSALPPPLPGYQKRERKPKVYASYAVSSDCCMHGDKLEQNEMDRGKTPPRTVRKKSSTPTYNSLPRKDRCSSQPRARSNSFRLPSPAPSVDTYESRPSWKNSLRSSESPARSYRGTSTPTRKTSSIPSDSVSPSRNRYASKSPERKTRQSHSPDQSLNTPGRRSLSSDGMSTRSSQSSTDWGYTSYSSFTSGKSIKTSSYQQQKSSSSSTNYSHNMRNTSYEESDEAEYGYGGHSKGYGGHNKGYGGHTKGYGGHSKEYDGQGSISLGALKTPEISPWDNMGILGLSSKMFSDTSNMKEGLFSSSSSSIIRRESISSHAM